MIEREGREPVRIACEGDETDQIVGPPLPGVPAAQYEVPEDLLHRVEAADAAIAADEVPRLHGPRAIDDHRDGDALALHLAHRVSGSRTGEGEDEAGRCEREQRRR